MATLDEINAYRESQRNVATLAYRELLDFWDTLDLTDPVGAARALEEFTPRLVRDYGEIGASLAADFYDGLRESKGFKSDYAAVMASTPATERVQASTRWAVDPLFRGAKSNPLTALSNVASIVQRFVQEPGRQTVIDSTAADPEKPRWARIPSGGRTCAFCLAMASRGAVYSSEATSEKDFHPGDNCQAVPIWDSSDVPEGYDLDAMERIYRTAKRNSNGELNGPDGVLAAIRRQPSDAARLSVEQMHANEAAGRGAGATLGVLDHSVPKTGYSLAVSGHERIVATGDALESDVADFVRDNHVPLAGDHRYLGLWENEGKVYLDVVEVWPDREATIRLAHERGELAIYDLGRGEEIATT